MKFGERIKHVRKQLNLTQTAFAKELNIARATLVRWEAGKFNPNYEAQRRFEEYCLKNNIKNDF